MKYSRPNYLLIYLYRWYVQLFRDNINHYWLISLVIIFWCIRLFKDTLIRVCTRINMHISTPPHKACYHLLIFTIWAVQIRGNIEKILIEWHKKHLKVLSQNKFVNLFALFFFLLFLFINLLFLVHSRIHFFLHNLQLLLYSLTNLYAGDFFTKPHFIMEGLPILSFICHTYFNTVVLLEYFFSILKFCLIFSQFFPCNNNLFLNCFY